MPKNENSLLVVVFSGGGVDKSGGLSPLLSLLTSKEESAVIMGDFYFLGFGRIFDVKI